MNNKGFAISGVVYGILLLFLLLIFGVLDVVSSRKTTLDKIREKAYDVVLGNNNDVVFESNWSTIYIPLNFDLGYSEFNFLDNIYVPKKYKISYTTNYNSNVVGTYSIKYSVTDKDNYVVGTYNKSIMVYNTPKVDIFDYTGSSQSILLNSGVYKFEAWGAQGGSANGAYGGKGSYTSGFLKINGPRNMYVHVGGVGSFSTTKIAQRIPGGYNGGGQGYVITGTYLFSGGGGGGATDFRLYSDNIDKDASLASRIMVAAGGGGYSFENSSCAGGTLVGKSVDGGSTGGTQTSGGIATALNKKAQDGGFGFGGDSATDAVGGGGGGYYGGAGASQASGNNKPAPGGSSYISGYQGCVAIKSISKIEPKSGCKDGTNDVNCSIHYSSLKFTTNSMIDGDSIMPSHDGNTTITGNSGNGYAKITTYIYYK